MSRFCIRDDYIERITPEYATDDPQSGFQPDVYTFAAALGEMLGTTQIIDIGCGMAGKLTSLHSKFSIVGIDFGANLEHARRTYPFGRWIDVDLEHVTPELLSTKDSIIICADVIEHLVDPTSLVRALGIWMQSARIGLLSTPERVLCWGSEHIGPPPNPSHVREWTRCELVRYLETSGLTVAFAGITQTHQDHPETGAHQGCQTTFVTLKGNGV